MKIIFKTIVYSFLIILISTVLTVAMVKAGSLSPSASPSATGYTLLDIYTRLATNATATSGNFSMNPAGSPSASLYTLEDIYGLIPTIVANTVKLNSSYLGVAGTLVPSGGDAVVGNVLSGKTFFGATQSDWNLQTGTMTNVGAQTITPTTTNTAITAGYHNGSGYCAGDADLVTGNIKSGVNLFGIDGNSNVIDTSTGTAVAGDMLSGKIAFVGGSQITGNVTAGNNITGSNGSLSMTITDGLYSGSKTCTASDSNLSAGNIKNGTAIFGVTGNLSAGGVTKTGQTTVYATNDDGTYQSGLAQTLTDVTVNSIKVAVNDASTGLMWQKCSAGLSGSTCATGSASALAWTDAILYCEYLELCNDGTYQGSQSGEGDCTAHSGALYTNWKLPNVKELFTTTVQEAGAVTDVKSAGAPYINQAFFPATVSSSYWSSTTAPGNPTYAFYVYFYGGAAYNSNKTSAYYVRCVRGQ